MPTEAPVEAIARACALCGNDLTAATPDTFACGLDRDLRPVPLCKTAEPSCYTQWTVNGLRPLSYAPQPLRFLLMIVFAVIHCGVWGWLFRAGMAALGVGVGLLWAGRAIPVALGLVGLAAGLFAGQMAYDRMTIRNLCARLGEQSR